MLVKNLLPKLAQREYASILFLFVLVISIGIIANNTSTVREPTSQAAVKSQTRTANEFWGSVGGGGLVNTCEPQTTTAWKNPENAEFKDGKVMYEIATSSPLCTKHALIWDFKFTIPDGAPIKGIEVEVWRKANLNNDQSTDYHIQLTKGFKKGVVKGGTPIPTGGSSLQVFGGPTDTWGASWTAEEITEVSSNGKTPFGVVYQARMVGVNEKIDVDQIKITIYYTDPPPPPPDDGGGDGGGSSGGGSSGGSSGGTSSGGGSSGSFPSPSTPGTSPSVDPNLLDSIKVNLSVPYLVGTTKIPLSIGNFKEEIEVKPGTNEYEMNVKSAKIKLGGSVKVEVGGGESKVLGKKLTLKTKAPKHPLDLGNLILGDVNGDNRVDRADIEGYLKVIVNPEENKDINQDNTLNSLDWAVLLANFGKSGD